jgi:hypothetical protein
MYLWVSIFNFNFISLQPRIYCTYSVQHLGSFNSGQIFCLTCILARSFFFTPDKDLLGDLAFYDEFSLVYNHEQEYDLFH